MQKCCTNNPQNHVVKIHVSYLEMYFILILVNIFLVHAHDAHDSDFIVDYFFNKKVINVIGFTCYDLLGDVSLIRNLNKKHITASSYKLNESKIQLLTRATYWKIGILVDTRCYNTADITLAFNEATEYRLFDELRSWLILGNNLKNVLNVVNDKAFGISTDFVIATFVHPSSCTFHDVYNIFKERGSALNVTFYGNWNSIVGLNVSLTQSKFRRRANFHRLVIKAMYYKSLFKATDMPLEEYYEDFEHKTRDSQSKFSYHVLSHLSDIYNFSLHSRESPLWVKGDKVGPIERALTNRDIDITGTPISFTTRRLLVMKYVHQDWPFRSCFFFRNPESTTIKVSEIFRPLTNEVWFFIGFATSLSVAALLMALRHHSTKSSSTIFSDSLLIVLGALCQQGTGTEVNRFSFRIAFLFVMIFSLLIFNYYSASVVSARLDDSTVRINDSLVQLAKLNLKMATEDMVYLDYFMKKPDWDTMTFYQNYWKKIPESKQYLLPDVGMSLVQKGGFAYHTHVEIAYLYISKFFAHREICEVVEVHLGGPLVTAFGVHYNSTFVDIGRVGLMRIAETGLRIRQIHRWQYGKPICHKEILSATSITIYEFAPHIIILLVGVMLALTVFAFELFFSNRGHLYVLSRSRATVERFLLWGEISI